MKKLCSWITEHTGLVLVVFLIQLHSFFITDLLSQQSPDIHASMAAWLVACEY